jgi:hypothetical protein
MVAEKTKFSLDDFRKSSVLNQMIFKRNSQRQSFLKKFSVWSNNLKKEFSSQIISDWYQNTKLNSYVKQFLGCAYLHIALVASQYDPWRSIKVSWGQFFKTHVGRKLAPTHKFAPMQRWCPAQLSCVGANFTLRRQLSFKKTGLLK